MSKLNNYSTYTKTLPKDMNGKEWAARTDCLSNDALFRGSNNNPEFLSTHACTRYLKPEPSNAFHATKMSKDPNYRAHINATFLHDPTQKLSSNSPCPLISNHNSGFVKGRIEGDLHSRNTNPGYSRNELGGFYTS